MANDIRIIIDGQTVDVFDSRESPIKLDFQIEDVQDFSKRKGSGSSTTYSLPATQINSKIFGLFGRVSASPIDTIKTLLPAVIEVGTVPILTGKAKLVKVTQSNDYTGRRGQSISIAFIAENSDWFSLMDGLTLQDIDWSDLDHAFNDANILSGFNAQGNLDDYGYTLIKWKDWTNVVYVTPSEFTPFLFAKSILTRAFNIIGYTVDSTFITQTPFSNCMHPMPLKNYGADFFVQKTNIRATKTTITPIVVTPAAVTVVFDDEVTPPNDDPNGNYNPVTGVYTAPYSGTYRFKSSVVVNNLVVTGLNALVPAFSINTGAYTVPGSLLGYVVVSGDTMALDETFTLVKGDTVEFVLGAVPTVTSYDIELGIMEVEGQEIEWISGDTDMFFDYLVPNWNLKDYIKGLTEMFNLYIYADSAAKTVRIETRDFGVAPFIDGSNDISQDIDLNKLGEKSFIQAEKDLIYQYKTDSNDTTAEVLNDGEQLPTFSGQYTLSDPNATGKKEIKNSFFAPTIGIRDTFIAGFAGDDTPPLIPMIWPEDYNEQPNGVTTDYIFTPRILYHFGLIVAPAGGEPSPEGTISLSSSNPNQRNNWPKSFMVDYDDPTGLRPSLAYGQETITFGVEIDGLVRKYYLSQLASVNNGVQRTEWWRAKITDIIAEDFRNRFVINGDRYVLQKIAGYNPTRQDSTKIILLEDKCATQDDVDAINSPAIQGVVNNG